MLSVAYTDAVGRACAKRGVGLHIDGARLLNAAAAAGCTPARLAAAADTVCLCLSKGVGAPVGSVLVGPSDFVVRAKRLRKAMGGAMRQAGCLAAAGLVGLTDVAPRLAADHARCAGLAARLAGLPGTSLRDGAPPTNIVFLKLHRSIDVAALQAGLLDHGIAAYVDPGECRLVTHHQVDDAAVDAVVAAWDRLVMPMVARGGRA